MLCSFPITLTVSEIVSLVTPLHLHLLCFFLGGGDYSVQAYVLCICSRFSLSKVFGHLTHDHDKFNFLFFLQVL